MRCPHCQHENREGARFCAARACAFGSECPACGRQPPPGAAFCDHPPEDKQLLHAGEFIYETWLFPDQAYTFQHALTHEVAYGSLLQERRRVLHACIGETLEALAGDRMAERVERLAHHAVGARYGTKPWCTAGSRARRP